MLHTLKNLIVPESVPSVKQLRSWSVQTDGQSFVVSGATAVKVDSLQVIGEVWLSNAAELRRAFSIEQPASDLELLARLWSLQGTAILSQLQGAFCFVVWNETTGDIQIVRDPVGARTLYIASESGNYWLAPKLHTAASFISRQIDPIALRDYLCCAFVPGGRTMFKGVCEVRPGTISSLHKSSSYWRVEECYRPWQDESLEWHAQRLRAILEEVVAEQLPENEDVGCYLSGGLDSSSIAALAHKLHNREIHCFSIHFGSECPNELVWSQMVAEHCGLKHHLIEITSEQMWQQHWDVLSLLDDPIGDPLTVPNLLLGQAAKQHAKVILNGEGGDPCFGGPKNQPMMLESLYQDPQEAANRAESLTNAYLASFQKCSTDLHKLIRPSVYDEIKSEPSTFEQDLLSPGNYVNKLLLINTRYKGADHILTKVNNITSALNLEGRSPLFDRRVVDASLSIPPHFKLRGAQEKAVLKAAVQNLLPEAILARPKSGMMVPVQYWYRKAWNARARRLLLARDARIKELLDPSVIKDWLDYRGDIWGRYGVKLWLLTTLEMWLRLHW